MNPIKLVKPTIGRVVHFTTDDDRPRICAALITDVLDDGSVSLHVLHPPPTRGADGWETDEHATFSEAPAGTEEARGKWGWPAREPS